jgi:hypothetical protein
MFQSPAVAIIREVFLQRVYYKYNQTNVLYIHKILSFEYVIYNICYSLK